MKQELLNRLLNIALRGLSMLSRFILIFFIAKLLTPAEVGLYGLMLATVSLSVLFLGADYHSYSLRELLFRTKEQWSFVIQNQMVAHLILYVFLLPAQILIFVFGYIEWKYALWFFALLIFEHIAQEINWLLIAMQRQIVASLTLFIRMGSWVLVIVPLMLYYPQFRNVESIYAAWLIGVSIAVVVGGFAVKSSIPEWSRQGIDKEWIKKGFKVGGLFLIATISFKGLMTFDRFAVQAFSDLEVLGVYIFYIGVVMGLYGFLDPAVFSFLYPRMLQSYQANQKQKYRVLFKELIVTTMAVSVVLAAVIKVLIPLVIQWIGKPIYGQYLDALDFLILAGFIYALTHIPHYALYAMKGDKWIVLAHISSLIAFFISLIFIRLENGIETVALALIVAFTWMLTMKSTGYFYTKRNSTLLKAN